MIVRCRVPDLKRHGNKGIETFNLESPKILGRKKRQSVDARWNLEVWWKEILYSSIRVCFASRHFLPRLRLGA
jgi:hypothetical protein